MNILNTYLTKRAMVLPYLVATGGSGAAYYNEGGDLGLVATYNKSPLAGMNFNLLAYTMNDAALWGSPTVFKAPLILSKIPKHGILGPIVYNTYNKTPLFVKNVTTNAAVTSLPYMGAEYVVMNDVIGSPAPQGVAGGIASHYGLDKSLKNGLNESYNFANNLYDKMLTTLNRDNSLDKYYNFANNLYDKALASIKAINRSYDLDKSLKNGLDKSYNFANNLYDKMLSSIKAINSNNTTQGEYLLPNTSLAKFPLTLTITPLMPRLFLPNTSLNRQ